MEKLIRKLSSSQIIIFGFMLVILTGTLVLMLPVSSQNGGVTNFLDALFTATSATCVTGLVVRDTATYWSSFGQFIILALIQIGGMGVITISLALTIASGRKIGIRQRNTMKEAISAHQVGGILRFTGFIVRLTLIFEALGALLLLILFIKEFSIGKALWYSVFHSISAFCNAGFDLMGVKEPYSSLVGYSNNLLLNGVIMGLIVIGGIGFLTWQDIFTNRHHIKRYRMQTKLILVTSFILIVLPAICFYALEFKGYPLQERILLSLFQSVTPRTAGFNTADLNAMSEPAQALTIILMLIGGSPGSTAGGMKTTTFAVVIATSLAVFNQKESTSFFRRRVAEETIRNALTIFFLYVCLFSASGMVISAIEELPLLTCMFETASAIGTVGLTLGITRSLSSISKIILIFLMYAGRVGGLTLVFSAISHKQVNISKLPVEKLTVG